MTEERGECVVSGHVTLPSASCPAVTFLQSFQYPCHLLVSSSCDGLTDSVRRTRGRQEG